MIRPKNVYKILDTRTDKGILALHDPARPFALVAFGGRTGFVRWVWRYAHKSSAIAKMRDRIAEAGQ
jgi:hypothetical protein